MFESNWTKRLNRKKKKRHASNIHENAVEHIEELYFIFPFNFSTNFTFLLIL